MKLSYWGFIKEKEFKKWLDSFDIDYSYSYNINEIIKERQYELLVPEWDLLIKWNISDKEYDYKLGGCITKINLSTWENGFANRSKWINLELSRKDISKVLKIKRNGIDDTESDISIFEKELDDYMIRINPELSKKFIRDKKIKEILSNN